MGICFVAWTGTFRGGGASGAVTVPLGGGGRDWTRWSGPGSAFHGADSSRRGPRGALSGTAPALRGAALGAGRQWHPRYRVWTERRRIADSSIHAMECIKSCSCPSNTIGRRRRMSIYTIRLLGLHHLVGLNGLDVLVRLEGLNGVLGERHTAGGSTLVLHPRQREVLQAPGTRGDVREALDQVVLMADSASLADGVVLGAGDEMSERQAAAGNAGNNVRLDLLRGGFVLAGDLVSCVSKASPVLGSWNDGQCR